MTTVITAVDALSLAIEVPVYPVASAVKAIVHPVASPVQLGSPFLVTVGLCPKFISGGELL
ncbi:MAG: hypothetical protein K8R55_05955 [Desulfuromonadaceae bacterium]|nr:hypothetical protein [Desulfuromonadaceae bacterium]